jgi:PPOX class probable F420-dependent enzyme
MLEQQIQDLAGGGNYAARVSLMPDGSPQSQMTWVDHDGEHILLNCEPQRQFSRNVARDPRVSVMVFSSPFVVAEVRGTVVETITGDEALAHIEVLAQRYTGKPYAAPIGPQGRVLFKIRPDKQIIRG